MIYVVNAFSLQMLDGDCTAEISERTPVEVELHLDANRQYVVSAIGHADTAYLVSQLINQNLKTDRININLTPADELIVAQVIGGRLPEGCTTLPEGIKIKFYSIRIKHYQ
jgi:hypothetical protein